MNAHGTSMRHFRPDSEVPLPGNFLTRRFRSTARAVADVSKLVPAFRCRARSMCFSGQRAIRHGIQAWDSSGFWYDAPSIRAGDGNAPEFFADGSGANPQVPPG
jgi:hypothetical protein